MFQTNKNSYVIVAICSNGEKVGRYTFTEGPDDDWSEIANKMFYEEFKIDATEMRIESREIIK